MITPVREPDKSQTRPTRPADMLIIEWRREIAGAEHAVTAMRWAAEPSIAPVLSGLAEGSIPLTHQALDGLPQRPALAHPRQTLSPPVRCPGATRR